MIDIDKLAKNLSLTARLSTYDQSFFLTVPYFYATSDESIAIRVSRDELGRFELSDCHTTMDYLELRDINLDDYSERLDKIMKRFSLRQDSNVFRMTVPTDDVAYLELYVGYFIQALTLIAYINL